MNKGIRTTNAEPTVYRMRKVLREQRDAKKLAEDNGHELTFWRYADVFEHVSIAYCKKCHREVVIGLPLESPIGRAIKEKCNEDS